MYYVNIFLFYSICGFLFEGCFNLLLHHNFKSGIMFGPYTPIYGVGILLALFIKKMLNKTKLKEITKFLLFLIISFISLSIIEQCGGWFLEKFFHKTLWSYTDLKYNITKFVSLEISLAWAFMSLIIVYIIHPKVKKIIHKIPKILTYIMSLVFIIDMIVTFFKHI